MTIFKTPAFKVLIVSENINFRNILAGKLRTQDNFEVEFATGGFHLLHLLEKHKDINLIICNEDMADMPAHEIITMIRLIKTKAELPILFISKNGDEEEICDLIFLGANDYIVQTANYRPIIERAQKYLHQIKSNAA